MTVEPERITGRARAALRRMESAKRRLDDALAEGAVTEDQYDAALAPTNPRALARAAKSAEAPTPAKKGKLPLDSGLTT